jgi:NAD-dependent SIR2 family protein deacetylase
MKKVATKKGKKSFSFSEPIVYPICPFCKETMRPGVAYYGCEIDNNIYAWQCGCSGWSKEIKKEWGIE